MRGFNGIGDDIVAVGHTVDHVDHKTVALAVKLQFQITVIAIVADLLGLRSLQLFGKIQGGTYAAEGIVQVVIDQGDFGNGGGIGNGKRVNKVHCIADAVEDIGHIHFGDIIDAWQLLDGILKVAEQVIGMVANIGGCRLEAVDIQLQRQVHIQRRTGGSHIYC